MRFIKYIMLLSMLLGSSGIAGAGVNSGRVKQTKYVATAYTALNSVRYISSLVLILKNDYEFILFYEQDCKYCIDFAPILKQYSNDSNISVLPISLGNSAAKISSLFPNASSVDQNTIEQFFGKGAKISTPTLFIWNKTNGHIYPIASGMHTYDELAERMNELAPKILKKETELGTQRSR